MIFDRIFRAQGGHNRVLTTEDLARVLTRGAQSASGKLVSPESALQLVTVFACVRVLAESVGQLPCHLYERRDQDKRKAIEHPLHQVLHVAPNEQQTPQEFWEFLIACLALRGNFYSQINWVGAKRDRVGELLPFHPSAVTPRQHKGTREVVYDIVQEDNRKETLPAREVLHVKLLPLDGVIGASPIRHAREAIGLAMATEEYGARLFGNGARPGGVIQYPGKLSDPAYERVKESWANRHQGVENAHRVAVLEEGATWQSVGIPPEDAQFLQTRKYQRSEIAGLFRVPPHLIGDLERATFSNIEHQGLDFVVHALVPYLTRIEQRIRLQLLSKEERRRYFAKFNAGGLMRGDMTARSNYYTRMLQNGALSPNEIRELEDRNPREGGDIFLTPLNMSVVDDAGNRIPETEPGKPVHAPAEDDA